MVENMSEKKSPPRKEKPSSSKTPQSAKGENKTLKRKLFPPGGNSEDEEKKTTPKRRRSLLAGEGSPPAVPGTPKTPGGMTRLTVPLSERQQMALLMQMTAEETQQQQQQQQQAQQSPTDQISPRPSSPHSTRKTTPLDKKVNKRNERGETPLHVAAIRGDEKQTKRLLKAGADVNVKDYAGWTPLHEACNHGWLAIAKQLVKAGANVNVQGLENDTPLHDAAINGHAKLVELLVRHGANPLQINLRGKSPMDVAANENIGKLLQNELIASSSSSSSADEVRSPTSPESNASEDDKKDILDSMTPSSLISSPRSSGFLGGHQVGLASGGLHSGGLHKMSENHLTSPQNAHPITTQHSTSIASSIFKKVHVTHHMDKSASPRLMLKFQHIKTNANRTGSTLNRARNSGDAKYRTYSVSLGTHNDNEYDIDRPLSPADSSSSNDSDLYDPQLEITTFGSKRALASSSSGPGHAQGADGHRDLARDPHGHRDLARDPHGQSLHQRGRWDNLVHSGRNNHGHAREFRHFRDSLIHSRSQEQLRSQEQHGGANRENTILGHNSHEKQSNREPVNRSLNMNMDSGTSHLEAHSSNKTKREPGMADSSQGPMPDSQMPTLSQESGPFEPHFEDISDAEDSNGPTEVDSKPTSSLSSLSPHIPVSSQSAPSSGRHPASSRADVSSSSDTKQTGTNISSGSSSTNVSSATCNAYSPTQSSSSGGTSHGQASGADTATSSGVKLEREPLSSKNRHSRESHGTSIQSVTKAIKTEAEVSDWQKYSDQVECKPSLIIKTESLSPKSDKFDRISPRGLSSDKEVNCSVSGSTSSSLISSASASITTSAIVTKSTSSIEKDIFSQKNEPMDFTNDLLPFGIKVEKDAPSVTPECQHSSSPTPGDKERNASPSIDQKSPKSGRESVTKVGSVKVEVSRTSPKLGERELRESRDSRDSPKSDKDNSKPPSPKVPPLKIIIPPKNSPAADKDAQNLKTLLAKPALPYVLNPTQDLGQVAAEGVIAMEVLTSQASSRASSVVSDMETDKVEGTVSSTQAELGVRQTRNKTMEKILDKEKDKEEKTDDEKEKSKDDGKDEKDSDKKEEGVERRLTRSAFRTQQQQQKDKDPVPQNVNGKDGKEEKEGKDVKEGKVEKEEKDAKDAKDAKDDVSSQNNDKENQKMSVKDEPMDDVNIHPRKRKLRQRQAEQNTTEIHQVPSTEPQLRSDKPSNPFELYLDIRKKVASRRSQWLVVTPKAPQGFKDYLMVSCNYVLEGKTHSRLSVPMLTPPNSLTGPTRDLFEAQERERYKLRLQHVIEREKLMLSMEQETIRIHGRAARAMANQHTPLSMCSILREEEIYNNIQFDSDKDKNVRTRYNGRQLLSWLQDVDDKYDKIKRALLSRHHHEVESLFAFQKLEWEWKLKEEGIVDHRSSPSIDDLHVPMIQINDEFDLLPS